MRVANYSVSVNDVRRSLIGELPLSDMDSVCLHDSVAEVAEEDDLVVGVAPLLEGVLRRRVVGTHPDHLRAKGVELVDVLRMTADLALARASETLREKEEDDGMTMIVSKRVELAVGAHQREVRSAIADCDH